MALGLALCGCATVESRIAADDWAGACRLDTRRVAEALSKRVQVRLTPLSVEQQERWLGSKVVRPVEVGTVELSVDADVSVKLVRAGILGWHDAPTGDEGLDRDLVIARGAHLLAMALPEPKPPAPRTARARSPDVVGPIIGRVLCVVFGVVVLQPQGCSDLGAMSGRGDSLNPLALEPEREPEPEDLVGVAMHGCRASRGAPCVGLVVGEEPATVEAGARTAVIGFTAEVSREGDASCIVRFERQVSMPLTGPR